MFRTYLIDLYNEKILIIASHYIEHCLYLYFYAVHSSTVLQICHMRILQDCNIVLTLLKIFQKHLCMYMYKQYFVCVCVCMYYFISVSPTTSTLLLCVG